MHSLGPKPPPTSGVITRSFDSSQPAIALVIFGEDTAPLDRMAGAAVLPEIGMQHMRGPREGGIAVAEIHLVGGDRVGGELAPHGRRAGFDSLAAVRDRRQQLVVHLDQRRRILGDVAVVGDNEGDGLADIGHLAVGECKGPHMVERGARIGMPHHPALGHGRRQVVQGDHRVHARDRERRTLVDAANDGMRMRAAREACVQHVRDHHVVDEAALAAQQRRVFDAGDAGSDQRGHARSFPIGGRSFWP
jgi:hypothetical protein